jgi:hypothetical protein
VEGICHSHNPDKKKDHLSPGSVFMTTEMMKRARQNAEKDPESAKMIREIIEAARPWLVYSDDQLWEMMFGNTIKRSWMVWSDGYCPSCKTGVPMYNWLMDPFNYPWKVRCPHCQELFPKNDFGEFYRSGMDTNFIFDPSKADRSLLFNAEHPDPSDPLYKFGIDDGEGWMADGHRWRFIGAYLIYGQWKGLIHKGILKLSEAYAVTGDTDYSYRAGILLDRVADLYPSHDFGKQGVMYEGPPLAGYVSTWHDACAETRSMAIAYDMVRSAIAKDTRLSLFLSGKAEQYSIKVPKKEPADVVSNISKGILTDPQSNRGRIYSNYPQTEMTLAILKKITGTPADIDSVNIILDSLIARSTSVDGLTGEKGLTAYTSYATGRIAEVLALFNRADPLFLPDLIKRHPRLKEMFTFHIDVWCRQLHYPNIGDCGTFAAPDRNYVALSFSKNPGLNPSMYSFLWQLYEATSDHAFIQVLYHENGGKTDNLPYDIFAQDPRGMRKNIEKIIRRKGITPEIKSVNKKEWHLAVLKSGDGDRERAVWIDYDAGGYHSHADGLNIGLFAFGLDLLPDFGYPPVQFGGWESEKTRWYSGTSAHNTVQVDGKDQINLAGKYLERKGFEGQPAGKTTLWSDGSLLKAIRAEVPQAYEIELYERTVAMVDVSADDFYVFDLFRVRGGKDHARMTYSSFSTISAPELNLVPSDTGGLKAIIRDHRTDKSPPAGWSADWKIEDLYETSVADDNIHLRLTDLTEGASASVAKAWIVKSITDTEGEWIPAVVTRRIGEDTLLASEFVSILQPYISTPFIASVNRLPAREEFVAVEIVLSDGRHDLWITGGGTDMVVEITSGSEKIEFSGDMLFLRRNKAGSLSDIAMVNASFIRAGEWYAELAPENKTVELQIADNDVYLRYGSKDLIKEIKYRGKQKRLKMTVRKD